MSLRSGEGQRLSQRPDRPGGWGGHSGRQASSPWAEREEGQQASPSRTREKAGRQHRALGPPFWRVTKNQPERKRTVYGAAGGAGLDTTVPHAALTPPRPLGKVGLTLDPQQASDAGATRTLGRCPQTRAPMQQRAHGPGSSSAGSPAAPPPLPSPVLPPAPRPCPDASLSPAPLLTPTTAARGSVGASPHPRRLPRRPWGHSPRALRAPGPLHWPPPPSCTPCRVGARATLCCLNLQGTPPHAPGLTADTCRARTRTRSGHTRVDGSVGACSLHTRITRHSHV